MAARLVAAAAATLFAIASAHSFLSVPMPFSNVVTCRIGGNAGFEANCPGPCPNYNFRDDMRPENPAATYKRGDRVTIRWTKNNHFDGFTRLTIVPLDEMMDKRVHDMGAFYFGCWTNQEYACNDYEKNRDCYYDRNNLAYKTQVTIPTIYPDGVYVLGWTWYGGGKGYGSFGDYYDCSYIRIQGGPLDNSYKAVFESPDGYCMASVNKLGICDTEPCKGDNWSKRMKPFEFTGKDAPVLQREWYESAMRRPRNIVHVAETNKFGIKAFSIIDTRTEERMEVDQDKVIYIDEPQRITIRPETFGTVTAVEWFVNGEKHGDTFTAPWSIAGEMLVDDDEYNYFDWRFPVFNRRVFVTAIAWSGEDRVYYSKDLVFLPKRD